MEKGWGVFYRSRDYRIGRLVVSLVLCSCLRPPLTPCGKITYSGTVFLSCIFRYSPLSSVVWRGHAEIETASKK